METKGKSLLVCSLIIILMSSCATPVVVSTPKPINTATEVPTQTMTPMPSPTPTSTPVPTQTPVPVYTELGKQVNEIADLLGWSIVLCDKSQTTENLDQGIFLYREDTGEFFCDLEGHMDEPVEEVLPQRLLALIEVLGLPELVSDGNHFVLFESKRIYVAIPSAISGDGFLTMLMGFDFTLKEKREAATNGGYANILRLWPMTTEEWEKLSGVLLYTSSQ
jgi:hypothetical protein